MSKAAKEQQDILDAHFMRCYYDYRYFAAKNHLVQNKDNQLEPFMLNDVQLVCEEIWADILNSGRKIRLYITKGRKQGISTWFQSRGHWMVTAKGRFKQTDKGVVYDGILKNQTMSIIAHDPATTEALFGICKRFDENLPPEFQHKKSKSNEHVIHYKDAENPRSATSLDSAIIIGTANTKNFGSGMTLTISHRSEVAKWPPENVEDLITSLNLAMPDSKNTAVLNESTAYGVGNYFHKGWLSCRYIYEVYQDSDQVAHWKVQINETSDEDNEFSRIFIPWFITKEYVKPVKEGFIRTAEEEGWVKKYNLSDEQIQWYRWALQNLCKGDRSTRSQEFPNCWQEAFLSSGTPSFDANRIIHFRDICKPPIARYECLLSGGQFITSPNGGIRVWKEPRNNTSYLIAADVAEGLEHGDFSVADVLDHDSGEQVAQYHGKCSPYEFASLLRWLGMRYNEAWLAPEKNNHGMAVVEELVRLEYPNIVPDRNAEPLSKGRKRVGWLTTSKTRPMIIDNLKQVIGEEDPGICCADTYNEMLSFKRQKDGREEADSGCHDDRTMCIAIGKYLIKDLDPVVPPRRNIKTPGAIGKGGGKKRPSNKAWH